ncbi:dynein regulatory complex subunit 3-like [Penaeus monodon]|uniref:dynein regulatory complex subunit 3-like n=1 Tax=Penaeus monodon TaxID=6687 RepID=UPI0018A73EFA|nr:dynein regulatory complex subunit 3-like [Penaeus monodon]
MWMFRALTKLELSNNSITVIRGLEKLTRLTWLDLSFNQIERINGLSELHELEVLALHNNQLDRVDRRSLLALSKLQVLTLANNNLSDINDVRSLRVLEELASVTLAGNPMCDSRYPNFVLAHLPRLAYLDQRRVTPAAHAEAALQYKSEVSVVEAQEEKGKVKEREAAEARKSQEEHRRAGVLALNDGSLFTRMFRGDKDMGVLLQLQGIHPVMAKYRDQFNAVCMKVFNAGLAHEEQRQSELELLHDALHLAKRDADCYARGVVKKLESQVEEVLKTAHELREAEEASLGDDQEAHAARVTKTVALKEEFESNICTITQDLLNAEVTLADQIKDVVGRAREELGTLVGNFLEEAAAELQEGRRLAYSFYCRLRELTSKVELHGGVSSEEADPRAAKVFEGGDTLTAALAGIHDRHLALIDARESDLQDHLHQWLTDTLNHIEKMEWARHRSRVEEITTLTARQRQLVYDAMPLLHD